MKLKKQMAVLGAVLAVDVILAAGLAFSIWKGREEGQRSRENLERQEGQERQEEIRAVSSGEEAAGGGKVAALTFDDGPSSQYTGLLLDGLKERNVKASFFLIGACMEGNEELVKRMEEEGHLIGVHCMRHTDLTKEGASEAIRQLESTKTMIFEITGKMPEYVRPPFGKWNEELEEKSSMEPVFWNVDSMDWKLQHTGKIVKKVMKDTKNGDIILMHDEFSTSVEAALEIIDNLQADGYTFVTVDELTID